MMMRRTYAEAVGVLVLEKSLLQCTSSAEPAELLWRVQASTWSRRLWTYHESGLARQLFYRFADKSLQLFEILDRVVEAHTIDVTHMFPSSIAKAALSKDDFEVEHDDQLDRLSMEAFTWCFQAEHADVSLNILKDDGQRLATVARVLTYRWTSWQQDEAICLAGLLDKETRQLAKIKSADQRMKHLILSLKEVPSQIIFLEARRIDKDGCRWIPASLLGRGDLAQFMLSEVANSTPSKRGLVIDSPGFIFTVPALADLAPSDMSSTPPQATRHRERLFVRLNGEIYGIYPNENTTLHWTRYKSRRVAIILQRPLRLHQQTAAVLLTIHGRKTELPEVTGRYEAGIYLYGPRQCGTRFTDYPDIVDGVDDRLHGGRWKIM